MPGGKVRSASSRPAIGPSTPMCRCPGTLVAASFHPASSCPEQSCTSRWTEYPSARVRGRTLVGQRIEVRPARQCSQRISAARRWRVVSVSGS